MITFTPNSNRPMSRGCSANGPTGTLRLCTRRLPLSQRLRESRCLLSLVSLASNLGVAVRATPPAISHVPFSLSTRQPTNLIMLLTFTRRSDVQCQHINAQGSTNSRPWCTLRFLLWRQVRAFARPLSLAGLSSSDTASMRRALVAVGTGAVVDCFSAARFEHLSAHFARRSVGQSYGVDV